jgi:hypothetical protein
LKLVHDGFHPFSDFRFGKAEIQRADRGDIPEDVGAEKLAVRVLKDDPNPAAEGQSALAE